MKLQTTDFYGTVILKDWMNDLLNRNFIRITGVCSVIQDVEAVGFKTRGTESNWAIRVVGRDEQWTVLGCQIRAVVAHPEDVIQSSDAAHKVP